MKVTIGGNRLGSGKKMTTSMHNYGRSSHDMGRIIRTSAAPGTLIPFVTEIGLNGDTFDIDCDTLVRTLPTNGPLFGSFKLQVDFFKADMRLYNAQLHNNKLGVGMDMSKVLFPQIHLGGSVPDFSKANVNQTQISQSSLLAYLGTRGLGCGIDQSQKAIDKYVNAQPLLMYWDIFKNYYANKQEENAYVITAEPFQINNDVTSVIITDNHDNVLGVYPDEYKGAAVSIKHGYTIKVRGSGLVRDSVLINTGSSTPTWTNLAGYIPFDDIIVTDEEITFLFARLGSQVRAIGSINELLVKPATDTPAQLSGNPILQPFPLSNIDKMRELILKQDPLVPLEISYISDLPYQATAGVYEDEAAQIFKSMSWFEMGGLAVKTYQSDRFNNWLSTEWIDGVNGIAEITAVDVSDGKLKMDALNLQQKVYNMLTRIAVTGGSYEDWQMAVYGSKDVGHYETPIYMGGLSTEIIFNEVVSTADSQTAEGSAQPLGTLGGRGREADKKRKGTTRIKFNSPGYFMGILSLTPRIDYSQGNKWFGKLKTMDDLHKPELDAIGFQELITDEFAAFDTRVSPDGTESYNSIGKQPAWIHYQTSTNECYGNFADENKEMFMTLNRRYQHNTENWESELTDVTTYIDPSKFNYAFADTTLNAQNFWVQIALDITARRVMSAKIIPNL